VSAPNHDLHRLSELDRRGRWVAVGLLVLLVLIALVAALVNHDRWQPQGDDALIELRAWDVGTSRTPLVGQPSTSGSYGARAANVAHPGPLGFAVLSPGVRLLGPVTGTLLSTAALSAAALITVAWLLFRHLGPRGGAAGVVLGSLAAFSAGAAGLTDPLSSNFGRLALLAAAVGVWALLCGDLRVAPLTAAWWSFAAHQHLSVLPAAAVLAVVGLGAVAWWIWRAPGGERSAALAWAGAAVVVGLALWSPVLLQQVRYEPGNLRALADYSGDDQREDLGPASAASQVATVLGPQPFLGRSSPDGWDLVRSRSSWATALTFVVVIAVLVAGIWWLRRRERRFVAAAAMVGVLMVAGLLTGMNIPDSPEQGRLNFFHWAFALSFFWLLVLGWLGARLAPVVLPNVTHGRAVTAAGVAAAVALGVALTPLVVDRTSDRLSQPLPPDAVASLVDQVLSDEQLAEAEGPGVILVNGKDRFVQVGDTVGTRLDLEGYDVRFPRASVGYVHPSRVMDPCEVTHGVVVTLELDGEQPPPGREIARVDVAAGVDRAALARLENQARDQRVVLGADLEAALDDLPGDKGELIGATLAFRLGVRPREMLLVRSNLDLLIEHPPQAPQLDEADLRALRASLPPAVDSLVATDVTVHHLDRSELETFRPDPFARC
jgi:hypothetical protein